MPENEMVDWEGDTDFWGASHDQGQQCCEYHMNISAINASKAPLACHSGTEPQVAAGGVRNAPLFDRLSACAQREGFLKAVNAQEAANLVWAFAKLRVKDAVLMTLIAEWAVQPGVLEAEGPQAVAEMHNTCIPKRKARPFHLCNWWRLQGL